MNPKKEFLNKTFTSFKNLPIQQEQQNQNILEIKKKSIVEKVAIALIIKHFNTFKQEN